MFAALAALLAATSVTYCHPAPKHQWADVGPVCVTYVVPSRRPTHPYPE